MTLSLSARVAEDFLSKETASLSVEEWADLAVAAGYDGVCMRASQAGVVSSAETVARVKAAMVSRGLRVTMVTGDFDIVYNNERAAGCLRAISRHLDLAAALGAPLVRVAMKEEGDMVWAQRAADQARERGIRLAHQCHTQSLFETVAGIERTLKRIGRENFGLIYEPANLELCGEPYGAETVRRLSEWIFNVYLQNQRLNPEGSVCLETWRRGPVRFDLIPVHELGGVRFEEVFAGLGEYAGPVTVHQAGGPGRAGREMAVEASRYLRRLMGERGGGNRTAVEPTGDPAR